MRRETITPALQKLGKFLGADPPLRHSRQTYRDPCHQGCKACEYAALRRVALDEFHWLRDQIEQEANFDKER